MAARAGQPFAAATDDMACFYVGFAITLLDGGLYLTRVRQWSPVLALAVSRGAAQLWAGRGGSGDS